MLQISIYPKIAVCTVNANFKKGIHCARGKNFHGLQYYLFTLLIEALT